MDVPRSYSLERLREQLTEYAQRLVAMVPSKESVVPYTIEELHERIAESEAQYKAGEFYSQDEVHQMMDDYVKDMVYESRLD